MLYIEEHSAIAGETFVFTRMYCSTESVEIEQLPIIKERLR